MKKKIRKRAVWCIEEDLHFFTNILRANDNLSKASQQTGVELPKTYSNCIKRYNKLKSQEGQYFDLLQEKAVIQLGRGLDIDPATIAELKQRFPHMRTRAEILNAEKTVNKKQQKEQKLLPAPIQQATSRTIALQKLQVVDIMPSPPSLTISAKLLAKIEDMDFDNNGDIRLHFKPFR